MLPHAIRIAALVPLLAGTVGIVTGADFLGEAAGPGTDSHLRALSALLCGVGSVALWCAADLEARSAVFGMLCGMVVFGGAARLLGIAMAERPPWPQMLVLGMELGVTPALWLWWRSRRRSARNREAELRAWLGID